MSNEEINRKIAEKGFDTCNRTACQVPLERRRWFNTSTRKYYCQKCMLLITRWPENRNIFEDHEPRPSRLAFLKTVAPKL